MEIAIAGIKIIETSQEAITLCRNKEYKNAKKCLVKVKKSSSLLVSKTKDAVDRLAKYDLWLNKNFNKQAEEKNRLYIQIKNAEDRISSLNSKISNLNSSLEDNRRDIQSARERRAAAQRKKEDAEDKLDGISSPLVLIPGYALFWGIRELIENNSNVVERADNEIESCYQRQCRLENEISNTERNIRSETQSIEQLRSKIRKVTAMCSEQETKLSQTRLAMSMIVKVLSLYRSFADLGEEAVENTSKLEDVVEMALKFRQEIQESSGATANYQNGWNCLEEMLQDEISGISLEYTCSSCENAFKGIPWIKDDRVCCEQCGK